MTSIKHQIENRSGVRFIVISQRKTQTSQSFKHIYMTYHDQEETEASNSFRFQYF